MRRTIIALLGFLIGVLIAVFLLVAGLILAGEVRAETRAVARDGQVIWLGDDTRGRRVTTTRRRLPDGSVVEETVVEPLHEPSRCPRGVRVTRWGRAGC